MPKAKATKAKAGKDLSGACFCITGTMSMSRAQLTTAIKARGGDVAGSVTGKVTHLLSTSAEVTGNTSKVILARGKNVPIVEEGFLDACLKAKKLVDVKKFEISGGGAKKAAAKKAPAKKAVKKAPPKKKAAAKKTKAKKAAAEGPAVHPKVPSAYANGEVFVSSDNLVYDAELNQQDTSTNTDKVSWPKCCN
jgi:hypothetical protein